MRIEPPVFPCIVPGCRKASVSSHAVCNYHLFMEITMMVVGSSLIAFVVLASILWIWK